MASNVIPTAPDSGTKESLTTASVPSASSVVFDEIADAIVVRDGTPAFVCVLSVNATPAAATVTVPVNVGEAIGAFAAKLVVTVDAKFASSPSAAASSSSVLSAAGAPVRSALTCDVASAIASDLAVAIAVACAVETGFEASAVSSTFPRPTCAFVTPATVPVNVGEAIGAYVDAAVADASLASSAAPRPSIFD